MSVTAVQISERRQKVKTTVSDESIKMRKFISMTMTMLKIGFIGFGGGSALIPVIEDEVVEKDKIVSEEEFNDDVMIASITPGALPVEVATGIRKTGFRIERNGGGSDSDGIAGCFTDSIITGSYFQCRKCGEVTD